MDRNGFRNRMKQYKKAREENPGLKYWEWKNIPKYDEGGKVIPTQEEYIAEQIAARKADALTKSLSRTMPRVPQGIKIGERWNPVTKKVEDIYECGPSCAYTFSDNYGYNWMGSEDFKRNHANYGWKQVPWEQRQPGDAVLIVDDKGTARHTMMYDSDNAQGQPLFNHSNGGHDESAIRKKAKYPHHNPYLTYEFVGTPADSTQWINDYKKMYGFAEGGEVRDNTYVAPIEKEQVFIPATGAMKFLQEFRKRNPRGGNLEIVSPEFDILTGLRAITTLPTKAEKLGRTLANSDIITDDKITDLINSKYINDLTTFTKKNKNDANWYVHTDLGKSSSVFEGKGKGAYIHDRQLRPGKQLIFDQKPYVWWNQGKRYTNLGENKDGYQAIIIKNNNAKDLLQVKSSQSPIGLWNGKQGFVLPSEYVTHDAVNLTPDIEHYIYDGLTKTYGNVKHYADGGEVEPRQLILNRANVVYSNYDDAKDFDLDPITYTARKLAKTILGRGGISNCTLSATRWVDPLNQYMSAKNIFNNPDSGYTKISKDYVLSGDLLITKVPNKDSYHTMLVEGFDGDEPILRYSKGGHDTKNNLVTGRSLSEYHRLDKAQGGNHDEDHYFRYRIPNEYWLPEITVTPKK